MATVLGLAREQRRRQITLGELLLGDLYRLWVRVLGGRPPRPADAPDLAAVLGPVIRQYGQASGAIAADTYLRQREIAGLPDGFDVPVVDPAPDPQIDALFAWITRERTPPTTALALGNGAGAGRDRLLTGGNTGPAPTRDPGGTSSGRDGNTAGNAGGNDSGNASPDPAPVDDRNASRDPDRDPGEDPERDDEPVASSATRERPIDLDDRDAVDEARARRDLAAAAPRIAAQTGRRTVEDAVESDPDAVAWLRVGDGNPCGFCAVMISRGAVYLTRESALYIEGTREPYHDRCGCTCAPRFRTDLSPLPTENQRLQDVWYRGPAYFTGDDALNAMRRAVRAQAAGRDIEQAVFKGYEHLITHDRATVEEYRRKAQRGGRNGKRNTPDYPGDPRFR